MSDTIALDPVPWLGDGWRAAPTAPCAPALAPCYRAAMSRDAADDVDSLESLMDRYVAGELTAFDRLYALTNRKVFSFLLSMARDRRRAEDLCQVTYLKLHRARDGYIHGAALMPWLMAIARNVFLDSARRDKRTRVRITGSGELPEPVDERTSHEPSVGLQQAIEAAIAALSPVQREAFVLTRQSGLSHGEAARVLGTTETAIKLRVHRAHVALRAALQPFRSER